MFPQQRPRAGLPDGTFSNQSSHFGYILEGLGVENFGKFYGHLIYFIAIWYIFVICGIFSRFGMLYHEKSGNPAPERVEGRKQVSYVCRKDGVN
jgi:hypothetical protein